MIEDEPNNTPEDSTHLPLELLGCGNHAHGLDADLWDFDVPGATWISIRIDAGTIGSRLDPALTLVSDGSQAAQALERPQSLDINLVFPTVADHFTALLTPAHAVAEGEEYFYEMRVSEVKEPLLWNGTENEPNDLLVEARPVNHGDVLFGDMKDAFDEDWFLIEVPAGKHTVTVDVDAWEYGSAANYRMRFFPEGIAGQVVDADPAFAEAGDTVLTDEWSDGDPYGVYESQGSESLYFKIHEFPDNRHGAAYWYVVNVTVEGD